MIRCVASLLCLAVAFLAGATAAHEVRPAYLELRETGGDDYAVLWKVPALEDKRLGLYVRLPNNCKTKDEPVAAIAGGAYYERWTASCPDGLTGREIDVDGLRTSLTDVLVRISYQKGATQVERLTPEAPVLRVAGAPSTLDVARTYVLLGVEHIFTGLDHLLFVFALILLIHDRWMLVKTITAFTVAHSITLTGAALGLFNLPQKPVEATIALSIAFVASELVKMKPGERRLLEGYPWLVAFAFGLLHGFGFAGALKEIGLPQTDIPMALFAFNLGVEAGQLVFVGVVLLRLRAIGALVSMSLARARPAAAYVIGVVAVLRLVDRLASFGGGVLTGAN